MSRHRASRRNACIDGVLSEVSSGHPPPPAASEHPQGRWLLDAGPSDAVLARGRAVAHYFGKEVIVIRTRHGLYAVENRCPHMGRSLYDASVRRRTLTCTGHQYSYNLATGAPTRRTSNLGARLQTFDVKIFQGRLWLSPKDAEGRPAIAETP